MTQLITVTVIEKGQYPGVTVTFIPGRQPEVVLFDELDKETDRMFIDHLSFAGMYFSREVSFCIGGMPDVLT